MATFISVQDGDWSDTDTWDVAGTPGPGDVVVVTTGDTVNIDVTTGADTLWVDGTCNTAEDITFTLTNVMNIRGNAGGTGAMTFSAGCTLELDNSSNVTISLIPGWQGSASFNMNGTAAKPCAVTGSGGGAHYFDWNTGNGYPQVLDCSYVTFSGLRNGGNQTFDFTAAGTYNDNIHFDNCIFDDCVWFNSTFVDDEATIEFIDCTWKNSESNFFSLNLYYSKVSGSRKVTGCVFDKAPRFWGFQGIEMEDNLFLDGFSTINEAIGAETSWSGNMVAHNGTNLNMYQNITDDVWLIDDAAKTNPHAILTPTGAGNLTFDGIIFQLIAGSTDGDGDWIQISSPSGAAVITVQNCIALKGGSDNAATLITMAGGSNVDVEAYHNTVYVNSTAAGGDNEAGIVVGETYAGHADMILAKSNIFWTDKASATNYSVKDVTGSVSGVAPAAAIDYNANYNITDEAALTTNGFNGSPAHDGNSVNEDPEFYGDPDDATLEGWGASLGLSSPSMSDVLAELGKKNDRTGYDSNFTIAAFRTYIEGIMAPTNSNLEDAGHDSVTIGAVAYSAPPSGGSSANLCLVGVG